MENLSKNILPKEKTIQEMSRSAVSDISQFLKRVNEYILMRQQGDGVVVYRGEPELYDKPCRPNIFRRGVLNENPFFEKSLFDTMRQNKLTGEKRYLDNAIDAQHGEFPSRLLDVTYNCLTALYFAVTPYYHQAETALDHKDGMVYLFFIDEIFSPSAQNTNQNYDAVINRDPEWYYRSRIFWKNHKFIDHTKLNSRIIAQQGAFIFFPGDEPEGLPECMFCGICIPKESKPLIRRELKLLFGIHTGSIYPEIINLVEELSSKSKRLNTEAFSCENELSHILQQLEKELSYYLDYALEQKQERSAAIDPILIYIERTVNDYRSGILEFFQQYGRIEELGNEAERQRRKKQAAERFNQAVSQFGKAVREYGIGEFSGRLLISVDDIEALE